MIFGKMLELLEGDPMDINSIHLDVPTIKQVNAPGVMVFDICSTTQEDIGQFLKKTRKLILTNELVIVQENKA